MGRTTSSTADLDAPASPDTGHRLDLQRWRRQLPLRTRLPHSDPRHWQIVSLTALLGWGMGWLAFDQRPLAIPLVIGAALATQWLCGRLAGLPAYDPLSPLISALSLCILLRSGSDLVLVAGAVIAIASKFVIRIGGKHVFNPTNGAIAVLLLTGAAWVSPAQWGSTAWAAFLFACLAGLVLSRAKRADVALAFLGTFAAILFVRAFWLGDPLAIPLKQMQSGAILLFAFFMISDPKTTPDRRSHRIAFGMLVAAVGAFLILQRYRPEGLMYALFFLSPLVPLLDRWKPIPLATRFQWSRPTV